jgi:putative transposase
VTRLTIVDEYTRVWLAIDVARRLRLDDVGCQLAELFVQRGVPNIFAPIMGQNSRPRPCSTGWPASGYRPCLSRRAVRGRTALSRVSAGGDVMNCWIGSCLIHSGRKVLVERWRQTYNRIRPRSALGYRPPAPEPIAPQCAWLTLRLVQPQGQVSLAGGCQRGQSRAH